MLAEVFFCFFPGSFFRNRPLFPSLVQTVLLVSLQANEEHEGQKSRAHAGLLPLCNETSSCPVGRGAHMTVLNESSQVKACRPEGRPFRAQVNEMQDFTESISGQCEKHKIL